MTTLKEEIETGLNHPNEWRIIEKPIIERTFKRNFKRKCKICGREFIAGGNSSWCGCCSIEYKCNHCHEWIPFSIQKLYKLNFNQEYGCLIYCHCLGAKTKMAKGKCCNCGQMVEKRDQFCFGYDCGCHQKMYEKHNRSDYMKQIEKQNGKKYGPKNLILYNKSEKEAFDLEKELMLKLHLFGGLIL